MLLIMKIYYELTASCAAVTGEIQHTIYQWITNVLPLAFAVPVWNTELDFIFVYMSRGASRSPLPHT